MTANPVADTIAQVTPAWLSEVLSAAGHGEMVVRDVRAERVGTGQMGTTYRLDIDATGAPLPRRMIAKLAAEDPAARKAVVGGYRREVGFYQHLASGVGMRLPTCWHAAIEGPAFTLLLEDLHPRLPGVQVEGCTPAQATHAARHVAGLHASRWNDPTLFEHRFLPRNTAEGASFLADLQRTATERFIEGLGHHLPDGTAAVLRDAAAATADWVMARAEPFALNHGDYRLDNLMFHPDSDESIPVDWQTLAVGPPLRDVAYLLGTSLDVELRREHEEDIVAAYHAELVARGVRGYGTDSCFLDYRLGHLQGPMITMIGWHLANGPRTAASDAMFVAMAVRSCAAIRDLGSLAVLAEG